MLAKGHLQRMTNTGLKLSDEKQCHLQSNTLDYYSLRKTYDQYQAVQHLHLTDHVLTPHGENVSVCLQLMYS